MLNHSQVTEYLFECVCVCVYSRAFIYILLCLCLVCLCTQVVTDLSAVSGTPFLEIKPGHNAPYTLSVSPWKRGKQTGLFFFPRTTVLSVWHGMLYLFTIFYYICWNRCTQTNTLLVSKCLLYNLHLNVGFLLCTVMFVLNVFIFHLVFRYLCVHLQFAKAVE